MITQNILVTSMKFTMGVLSDHNPKLTTARVIIGSFINTRGAGTSA